MSRRPAIINDLVLKLAEGCNLNCSYCYEYRNGKDPSSTLRMTDSLVFEIAQRLQEFLADHSCKQFYITLHGGEPLLYPKQRMAELLRLFSAAGKATECNIAFRLQTNGTLVDEKWMELFEKHSINLTISLDGPAHYHDDRRMDRLGRGTHSRIMRSLKLMTAFNYPFSILAVYHPKANAESFCRYCFDELGAQAIDVLFPDFENVDQGDLAAFYNDLFDVWLQRYSKRHLAVRISYGIFCGILGRAPGTEILGHTRLSGVVIDTDGTYRLGDTIASLKKPSEGPTMNVRTHSVREFTDSPEWKYIYHKSAELPLLCSGCEVASACGGGAIAHRWREGEGFDNPSKYCSALKAIYRHAVKRTLGYANEL